MQCSRIVMIQTSNQYFSSFKIGNLFGVKDPIPGRLRLRVVYKFTCAGCNACYVGKTSQHFSTCVCEHLAVDTRHYQLSTQGKGGYPYSKRTTQPQSAITPCKSKIILLIYTFSHSVVTICLNQHFFVYLLFNLLCKSLN